MFESIQIGAFRSIKNATLENLGHLTVLAGKNGAGKTNVLKCIQWTAGVAASDSRNAAFNEVGPSVSVKCQIDGLHFDYSVATVVVPPQGVPGEMSFVQGFVKLIETLSATDAGGMFHQLIRRDGEELLLGFETTAKINPLVPGLRSALSLFPEHPLAQMIFSFADFMRRAKYYPMEERSNPNSPPFISGADYEAWREGRHEIRDLDEELNFKLLHLYLWKPDQFEELRSLIGPQGLGLVSDVQMEALPVSSPMGSDPFGNKSSYYIFKYLIRGGANEDLLFGFGALSFGTRRVIRLLVAILYDAASVYLIEQPEDGIHPGLLGRIFPLIRSYSGPAQFLVATHSPEILNRSDPREVRLVDIVNGRSTIHSLSLDEIQQANKYISDDGPLTDFLRSLLER